jgi:DNA-binding HxlR family transcriptional regulator
MPRQRVAGVVWHRWSLLIIRDMMVCGNTTFKQFLASGEGIARSILACRLRRLEEAGIVTTEAEKADGRKVNYRLTEKRIDLAPILLACCCGARSMRRPAPCAVMAEMAKNRE